MHLIIHHYIYIGLYEHYYLQLTDMKSTSDNQSEQMTVMIPAITQDIREVTDMIVITSVYLQRRPAINK